MTPAISSALPRRQLLAAGLSLPALACGGVTPAADRPRGKTVADLLAQQAVSVLDFIPAPLHAAIRAHSGAADVAPFIRRAIDHVLAQPGGGTVFFPPGGYDISSIDATNDDPRQFETLLRLVGAGRYATKLRALEADRVLLDATGRNRLAITGLQFLSDRVRSRAAIVLGRNAASPNCNGNAFEDVLVSGEYGAAGVISIAAESTSWARCRFENSNIDARHRCFLTTGNPAIVGMALPGPRRIAGPNTDNAMLDCEFYTAYDRASPIGFIGSAGYAMSACSVIAGDADGARLVEYVAADDVFTGPVDWASPHFEVLGRDNIVHVLGVPRGVSYFRGISSYGGNYVVQSGTQLLAQSAPPPAYQAVLQSSTWTVPIVPQGLTDIGFSVFGVMGSAIAFQLQPGVGTLDIPGFVSDSTVSGGRERIARRLRTDRS